MADEPDFSFETDPRVLLDLAREQLQRQMATADAIDGKTSTMFGAGSALVGLLLAVFAIREDVDHEAWLVVAFGVGFYAFVAWSAFYGLWIRNFDGGPDMSEIWDDAQTRAENALVPDLVIDYVAYLTSNLHINEDKARALKHAMIGVIMQVISLLASLIVIAAS